MQRLLGYRLVLFAVVFLGVVVIVLAGSGEKSILAVQTTVDADGTVVRETEQVSVDRLRRRAKRPGARAVVLETTHDFGLMDPLTMGEHDFTIRNVGDDVLKLQQGPTTCKCTLSRLSRELLKPGEEAVVTVSWNSGRDPLYTHNATVFTSDERNKVVTLRIHGRVRTTLRCVPDELNFARVVPGESPTASVLVYSDVWDEFDIRGIESSIAGLDWEQVEVSPDDVADESHRSYRRLRITIPSDLPQGQFAGSLRFRAVSTKSDVAKNAESDCELPIGGVVLRRLCVYGPAVDRSGNVTLGRVTKGEGTAVKLLLKVRDEDKRLAVRQIDTNPEFLNVSVQPHGDRAAELGLYDLRIELPKDAPVFRLPPTERGTIRIEFEHPRIDSIELPVDLVVSETTV